MNNIMKKKILHITVHLGGGVGKAILGAALYGIEAFQTQIIVLEEPEKKNIIENAKKNGTAIYVCPSKEVYSSLIEEADIVIVNWWNHPLMTQFLYEYPKIKCRLVAWIHVNGCTYPYVPFEFADRFDSIFFTSKYSYENDLWTEEQLDIIRSKSTVILGNGDFNPEQMPIKQLYGKGDAFRLGYVGTLNYSKMNRNYIKYCEKAIELCGNLRIVLVGDIGEDLKEDIEKSIYRNQFEITGYVDNVESVYLSFDALGYILNDDNYGTTENVILEAMAYGIPVVANDSGVERNIIDHQENGFLIHNAEEFAQCIQMLQENEKLQRKVGAEGRRKVCAEFSGKRNRERYVWYCNKVCAIEKTEHTFSDILGKNPIDWFLYFTGKDREIFTEYLNNPEKRTIERLKTCKPIYKGERKSSIKHFLSYFPQEVSLKTMATEMEER